MRRLAFAAAVCGTLALGACSDQNQSPTEPTVPPPSENFGTTCTHGRYPLKAVAVLIPPVFPVPPSSNKALKAEALVRVGAIALLWDFCQDRLARQAALKTIAWIDSKVLTAPDDIKGKAKALEDAILAGFGAGAFQGDFVTKLFKPGEGRQWFTTSDGDATLQLDDDAFDLPTLITVRRLLNSFRLSGFSALNQRPPFYDYDATNSATNNNVETHRPKPGSALMAFCYEPVGQEYPSGDGASIGHNPVGGGFELVPEVEVTPTLLQELFACNGFELRLGSLGRGLPGFGRYLGSMTQKLFLPTPLYAATVGGRGPIAGAPPSLSAFGLVLVNLNNVMIEGSSDPGGDYYPVDGIIGCGEGCNPPTFSIQLDNEDLVTSATQVTVTLVPENGATGKLHGIRVKSTAGPDWTVEFDDLFVDAPGDYHLVASAPGATFYTTGTFHVFSD